MPGFRANGLARRAPPASQFHFIWRTRYADWPALKKLEYVDELMEEIAGKRPALTHREKVDPLSTLTQTLGEYYKKKRALYLVDTPKTYDRDLRRLFSDDPKHYR